MKLKETMLNTQLKAIHDQEIGDDHIMTNIATPLRKDAFDMSDDQKIEVIAGHFKEIMQTLGLDLTDDSLMGTPKRVAKMYVKELFSGLNPENMPSITLFDNNYKYDEILVERDISFYSNCEHHFVPIVGKVHIGYISSGNVIGLSKLHRLVNHYARRPQVQERMTIQIGNALKEALKTDDIAVVVDADHFCVSSRGIADQSSSTVTSFFEGAFNNALKKEEFLSLIKLKN
ncbi:GTP cyclohydrolase I FolE [Lacihabitans sp. CCS-44]|uniref:GTP cyclohydrolase I FolE n=1 Tax=Lacihabitans sp. CCS-44 TaxID=2487331 RepID=UPI0020CFE773|nr:GTP cyclohydrolase I FolE [Lacihabitans sp. CCS-44]